MLILTVGEQSSCGWLIAVRLHCFYKISVDLAWQNPFNTTRIAQIAQSVEQRIENPRVGGSIPPLGTIFWCLVQLLPLAAYFNQHDVFAQIAQSVEQRIENPRVGGSIPPLGTIKVKTPAKCWRFAFSACGISAVISSITLP